LALTLSVLGVVLLGVVPGPVSSWANDAVAQLVVAAP
jgi:hypothetical protein